MPFGWDIPLEDPNITADNFIDSAAFSLVAIIKTKSIKVRRIKMWKKCCRYDSKQNISIFNYINKNNKYYARSLSVLLFILSWKCISFVVKCNDRIGLDQVSFAILLEENGFMLSWFFMSSPKAEY